MPKTYRHGAVALHLQQISTLATLWGTYRPTPSRQQTSRLKTRPTAHTSKAIEHPQSIARARR